MFFREPPILQAHNNSDIILKLPMGKRIRDIRWLSVWCRRFTVSFIFQISRELHNISSSTIIMMILSILLKLYHFPLKGVQFLINLFLFAHNFNPR